ncbi:MAG: nucleoside triphosphate pyrophosphohydrolase, partial [Alphaproteobacteria bacterium RIFOXYD12_FULL_60_8]
GLFDFNDVATAIADKLVRRHPHVFGADQIDSAEQQITAWEAKKAEERHAKAKAEGRERASALDGVSTALPAITRSVKIQARAARVGFDWPTAEAVISKLEEELEEVREEMTETPDQDRLTEEMGDLLMATVNLSRKLKIDPETALRHANAKFVRRFHHIEDALALSGRRPEDATLEEMEALWGQAKALGQSKP